MNKEKYEPTVGDEVRVRIVPDFIQRQGWGAIQIEGVYSEIKDAPYDDVPAFSLLNDDDELPYRIDCWLDDIGYHIDIVDIEGVSDFHLLGVSEITLSEPPHMVLFELIERGRRPRKTRGGLN